MERMKADPSQCLHIFIAAKPDIVVLELGTNILANPSTDPQDILQFANFPLTDYMKVVLMNHAALFQSFFLKVKLKLHAEFYPKIVSLPRMESNLKIL